MCVCVHGGLHCRRKAGASKWTESGPWAAPVCSFVVPKMGPKTGPKNGGCNIAGRRKGFQNGGPVSGTRVLHTPSAPLCVQWVAETPEPFVCFPCNGLDKASSTFHTHNIYIFFFQVNSTVSARSLPPSQRWRRSSPNTISTWRSLGPICCKSPARCIRWSCKTTNAAGRWKWSWSHRSMLDFP